MKYLKLTNKENEGQLVFLNQKTNEYNLVVIKDNKVEFVFISLVPYYLEDTDLYEEYEELEEDVFIQELNKQLNNKTLIEDIELLIKEK
jgi:hypothetical protein